MTRRSTPWSRAGAVITALAVALGSTAGLAEETTPAPKPFKEEQLASLLAPIALYPDSVLTQILIASTYPLEVVQAYRWVQQNKNLTGEALATAAGKQPWDPSVQGLTAIPEVLKMMDEKLDWTQKIGDAFLAQQKDVMDMVQKLRAKAKEEGNLKSDDHMKVSTEAAPATTASTATPATQVIVIESANPEVIYVPTYSPVTIYGSWWYPAYPPYYWPPPMGYPGSGFWWGVGIGIGVAHWGHHYSHYSCDWHGGDINIGEINIDRGDRNQINTGDRNRVNTGDRAGATNKGGSQKWSHDPSHRKGVSYRDSGSAAKYDKASRSGAASRDAYRGRTSAGTSDLKGGGTGAGAATRGTGASAGTRDVGAGARSGASAGNRAGAGSGTSGSRGTSATSSSRGGGYSGGSGSSSAFGGMGSGSRASSYGSRGGSSRGSYGGGSRGGGGGRRR
jgi:hypothetical protein